MYAWGCGWPVVDAGGLPGVQRSTALPSLHVVALSRRQSSQVSDSDCDYDNSPSLSLSLIVGSENLSCNSNALQGFSAVGHGTF